MLVGTRLLFAKVYVYRSVLKRRMKHSCHQPVGLFYTMDVFVRFLMNIWNECFQQLSVQLELLCM